MDRKQTESPPRIDQDALIVPFLLPFARKIRSGKPVEFSPKFEVPCRWDTTELTTIHNGLREWLKQGSPGVLAKLLNEQPFCIVHHVIQQQMLHLGKMCNGVEESDPVADIYGGRLLPTGTKQAARAALLTLFQGMWHAFAPGATLQMKLRKRRGHPRSWHEWDFKTFQYEYNELKAAFEKLDAPTNAAERPLQRRKSESNAAYLNRIIEVVRKLDSLSGHDAKSVKIRTGPHKGEWTITNNPISLKMA